MNNFALGRTLINKSACVVITHANKVFTVGFTVHDLFLMTSVFPYFE